jgi:hypothetical protein
VGIWETSDGSYVKLPSSSSLSRIRRQPSQPLWPSQLTGPLWNHHPVAPLWSHHSSRLPEIHMPVCPRHCLYYYQMPDVLRLRNGNVTLELLALSLNAWAQSHSDLGDAFGLSASDTVARIAEMPSDLQIRAIAMAYGLDPEELANGSIADTTAAVEHKSTGNRGFTEEGVPSGYDIAAGSVIGYRTWKAPWNRPGHHQLVGAYGEKWAHPSKPGHKYTAVCAQRCAGTVPNEDNCGCGFWAYWEPGRHISSHYVVGAIEGSGKVILGEDGFRSQHAVIRGLTFLGDFTKADLQMLEKYKAPVFDSELSLVAAVGTDLVYSPAARDVAVFSQIPVEGLESYYTVLKHILEASRRCIQSKYTARQTVWHDTQKIRREMGVVEKAIGRQVHARLNTYWKDI